MQNRKNRENNNANINLDKNNNSAIEDTKDSNQFMINWGEDAPPEYYSGDEQTDDFNVDNDYNKNLDLRMSSPIGGTFMHPMHDATLDPYENKEDFDTKNLEKEKK